MVSSMSWTSVLIKCRSRLKRSSVRHPGINSVRPKLFLISASGMLGCYVLRQLNLHNQKQHNHKNNTIIQCFVVATLQRMKIHEKKLSKREFSGRN